MLCWAPNRCGPGTWFSESTGDMVDSFAQDCGERVGDAWSETTKMRSGRGSSWMPRESCSRQRSCARATGSAGCLGTSGSGGSGRMARGPGGPMSGAAALPASKRSGSHKTASRGLTPAPLLEGPQADPVARPFRDPATSTAADILKLALVKDRRGRRPLSSQPSYLRGQRRFGRIGP